MLLSYKEFLNYSTKLSSELLDVKDHESLLKGEGCTLQEFSVQSYLPPKLDTKFNVFVADLSDMENHSSEPDYCFEIKIGQFS